tara:strand:- start:10544 stop:12703 length:2160 start_codon:yes stop_codon:yes gene_type:complete
MAEKDINIVAFLKLLNNYSQMEADQSVYDLTDKEKKDIASKVYNFTKDFKTEKLPAGLSLAGAGQAEDYANIERWSKGIKKALNLQGLDMTNPADIKKAQAYMAHAISITKGEEYAEKITGQEGFFDSELEDMMEDSNFSEDFIFKLNKIPRRTQGSIDPSLTKQILDPAQATQSGVSTGTFGVGEIVKQLKKSKYAKYFKDKTKYDFANKESLLKFLSEEVPSLKEEYMTTGTIDIQKAEDDIIRAMETPEGYVQGGFVGTVENLAKQFQNGDKNQPLSVSDLNILFGDVRNLKLILDNNVPLVSDIYEMQEFDPDHKEKGTSPYPSKKVGQDFSARDEVYNIIAGLSKAGDPNAEKYLKQFNENYLTETEKKEERIINTGEVNDQDLDFVPEEYVPLSEGVFTDDEGNLWRKGKEGGWQVKYNKATRETGAPTIDEFDQPTFEMKYNYEDDWTTLDKKDPSNAFVFDDEQSFENQLTPFEGNIEQLPKTVEDPQPAAPLTNAQKAQKVGSSLLKGAGAILDAVGGPSAIISYFMGKRGLQEAMKEVKPLAKPELSPLFMQHLRQTRELAKKGFHPDQARKFRKDLDMSYQKGLENAVRGSGGQRARFLAQSGVLDAQRSSALLDYAVADEKLQRENQDKYEKMMLFKENFDIQRTEQERTEDMERQLANKKAAAGFTSAAFTTLLSGLGKSSLVPNMPKGTTNLYNMFDVSEQTTNK